MEIFAVILKRLETVPVALQLNNEMLSHCEPARSGPISHTDLEPECRHCQRSAAVDAFMGPGLLHDVRNDGGC